MCGMAVLSDEGGSDHGLDGGDGVRMLPPPAVECAADTWGGQRGCGGCVCWCLLLMLWNLTLMLLCVGLLMLVFSLTLLPAALLLYTGFMCHTRVVASSSALCRYLDDNSCSALIILGFVMMSPLVVVAAATFCGLLRRLRLLLFFQPITGARYRGRGLAWRRDIRALV